jgi:hypothetical protein
MISNLGHPILDRKSGCHDGTINMMWGKRRLQLVLDICLYRAADRFSSKICEILKFADVVKYFPR